MHKFLCLSLVLLGLQVTFAQETNKISVSFNNENLLTVIEKLEQSSDKKFFYAENWIPDKKITASYDQVELEIVLEDIFKETLLNFYFLDDGQIVLTQNSIIYDRLPEGFFPEPDEQIAEIEAEEEDFESSAPVFYNDAQNSGEVETVRIGRQDPNNRQRRYTLSGRAFDKITGEPISNMAILLEGTRTGVSTDINGYYEIKLRPGVNMIRTKSLTNENVVKRVIIYNDGTLNLSLDENLEQLGEVRISSNADKNVSNANTGEEEIDIENIKNIPLVLGERDVMKVATLLPGISNTGEGSSGFNVRGGKEDQNLILLDDAVIYNPSHFFGIFSAINPFTTGEATVYKGNIPARYGGRLSSVFDIMTIDANTQEFEGEASIGPVTSNLAVQLPVVKEKSAIMIGGRGTYSDWILKNLDEEQLNNSTALFYDGIAKYNHEIDENNKLSITGYLSNDRFSITSDSVYSYQNQIASLKYEHRFNDRSRGALIFTNSNYKFNIDFEDNFQDNFESGYEINETEAKLSMKFILNKAHQFDYGVSGKLYNVDPGFIKPIGSDSNIRSISLRRERGIEAGAWIADDFKVSDALLLSAGIRFSVFSSLGQEDVRIYEEDQPKTDNTVIDLQQYGKNEPIITYGGPEARLSARFYLLPDLSVKASYNNTYQYIHTLSNSVTVSPTDTYRLSGYHIKPQRAQQYSLGFFKNWDNDNIETSIEGYYKTSENMLDFKTGANLFLNEFVETEVIQGEGKSYGLEFLLKKKAGDFNGWLSYTYSRSYLKLDGDFRNETVNNGEFFPSNYDKPHDFSLVTNYKLTQRFSFSANFVYQTGRPITYPTGKYSYDGSDYVLYSDRNQFRIPDYYRLDLSFNLEGNHKLIKLGHSFWNFSVYNVLGRNNPYSVYFVTKDGQIQGKQSSIFSVPVPTISYNFQF
ncbi:TonB-dependent receptor [Christiangramia sp. SM2212]|uniref:Carboxypeptidase-like regulatory domain-containing protein n=1 Tax=Christiangramia sediminicola TaxID=3073267 RepID=A0ABU1ER38_9FLAO|nr:carboxypeptidase-like regulatory domain-containing protein [Christiangramia sp. SM2212]MDR5590439.1 carboxypeptidase-like regulatory domain-containing protein [Christiangramia sp. SM2212]